MTAELLEPRRAVAVRRGEWPHPTPELKRAGFPDRACPVCGWRFFTTLALHEHRQGCSQARANLRKAGLAVTALNNSRRLRCDECGKVSTPSGIALHQRGLGHSGKTELT